MEVAVQEELKRLRLEIDLLKKSSIISNPKSLMINGTAVVESGSDAKGEWVKYYDGTMIQYGKHSQAIAVDVKAVHAILLDLPQPYANAHFVVQAQLIAYGNAFGVIWRAAPASSSKISNSAVRVESTVNKAGQLSFTWLTIGKYK